MSVSSGPAGGGEDSADEFAAMENDLFSDGEGSGSDKGRDRANNESGDDGNKNDDKDKEDDGKRKIKAKKVGPVKRVVLHEDMVCGKDGLLKLDELFKDFKLLGRGHELQDINAILHKLEHWVHILHPKYQFAQTLERLEFLGIKRKSIKSYLKKIRMGLITKDDAFMDENNLPEFDPSDHEMEDHSEHAQATHSDEFPMDLDTAFDNINPVVTMSDDDDDEWIMEALRKTEELQVARAAETQKKDSDRARAIDSNFDSDIESEVATRISKTNRNSQRNRIDSDSDSEDSAQGAESAQHKVNSQVIENANASTILITTAKRTSQSQHTTESDKSDSDFEDSEQNTNASKNKSDIVETISVDVESDEDEVANILNGKQKKGNQRNTINLDSDDSTNNKNVDNDSILDTQDPGPDNNNQE